MKKSRSSTGALFPPATHLTHSAESRAAWLDKAVKGFANTQKSNRTYYQIILERLWPTGHGIPGPLITEDQCRDAIDLHRIAEGKKAYKDVFRRLRELQGDEGFTCIIKNGRTYQLQSLEIGPKRPKRTRPKPKVWKAILEATDYTCAKCGKKEPEVKLSPDHRVPRSRGGTGDDENWQPLCVACNILKSAACSGCGRACSICFWAYPEHYAEVAINDDNRMKLQSYAAEQKSDASTAANNIIRQFFLSKK